MGDTPETGSNPRSESEADPKQKRSESEAKRLVSWAVRPSPSRPGFGEILLTNEHGEPIHLFFESMVAYDLSDRLLELAAELKTSKG